MTCDHYHQHVRNFQNLKVIRLLSLAIIPAQYGTNKFATQKGVKIGSSRDILPKVQDYSNKENLRQWDEATLRAGEGEFGGFEKIFGKKNQF